MKICIKDLASQCLRRRHFRVFVFSIIPLVWLLPKLCCLGPWWVHEAFMVTIPKVELTAFLGRI